MNFEENYPFSKLCSLRIAEKASFYCELSNPTQIEEILQFSKERKIPLCILGEGTNVVPTKPFNGLVVKNRLTGIKTIDQTTIEVASGENWHNFVEWSLKNSTFGLENLALIPGTVGAGPIQNIGAYGSEISDYVKEVCVLNTEDGSINVLSKQDCKFAYRTSVFKSKPELFILSVTFELDHRPKINVSYESLHNEILKMEIDKNQLTPIDIFELVSKVRRRALPDYIEQPNVGSFFKNVYLKKDEFKKLNLFAKVPIFHNEEGVKIPSAFLIEDAGWKGYRKGNIGISDNHSLVLITYAETSGEEIIKFANDIIEDVFLKTGIKLEIEPTLI